MYDLENLEWNSQLKIKALNDRVKALESGKAYADIKRRMDLQRARYERELSRKDAEIAALHRQVVNNRDMWFGIFKDLQDEHHKKLKAMEELILDLCSDAYSRTVKISELQEKLRKKMNELTVSREETQEQKDINQKLQSVINMDFKNSSVPSSCSPFRDKIPNNREKTDRLPGGQPGHVGHRRPHFEKPDEVIMIEDDPEIVGNPDYYPVEGENGLIRKQVIGIRMIPYVTEYVSRVYRSHSTGARYHAAFPEGIILDSTYDESIRSLIFMMKNHLNVAEAKIREFISDFTNGMLHPSRGMINSINREFSAKTEEERKAIFAKLATANVLYTDFTNVRHNGKLKNVLVVTDKEDVLYYFRDTKGDAAIKDTPLEYFTNILVHDHASVFFHYGTEHQDCGTHKMRRAIGVSENEPELTWHMKMHDLLKEMNTVRNKAEGKHLSEEQIMEFEKRYDEILEIAEKEYYDNPPGEYYRKGINLATEMKEYKKEMLLFLHNPEVDFTNNVSENNARKIKRHIVAMGTFRGSGNESGEAYCASMSVLQSTREKGENVVKTVRDIFCRKNPVKNQNRDEKGRFTKEKENTTNVQILSTT